MASQRQIKQRIRSVKSTKQITKAMELVAASKLRRAQAAVAGPKAYAAMAREILVKLRSVSQGMGEFHLFVKRPVKERLLLVITSDRGLAGAYNANVIRRMITELKADRERGIQSSVICVGKQVSHAASRIQGLNVRAVYQNLPDKPSPDDLRPILASVVGLYADKAVDAVDVISTQFVSTVRQSITLWHFLPAGFPEENAEQPTTVSNFTAEPSVEGLLQSTVLRLLDAELYQALLEATASEQSMRMLAMKNATDNATDIIGDLTLSFNNARQAAITQELAEITGGAEAMQ